MKKIPRQITDLAEFGFFVGLGLAGGWYLYAIRWVDKHSSWNAGSE
jgi:hypothetical protein